MTGRSTRTPRIPKRRSRRSGPSDTASPVSDDYTSEGSRFTGTVDWVQIDIAEDAEDLDHLISTEERLKIAMTRQ
jgi:hypothetical protein